jgi:DNA-directed RNA polymerase subunit N (RpoN/RPB10)
MSKTVKTSMSVGAVWGQWQRQTKMAVPVAYLWCFGCGRHVDVRVGHIVPENETGHHTSKCPSCGKLATHNWDQKFIGVESVGCLFIADEKECR